MNRPLRITLIGAGAVLVFAIFQGFARAQSNEDYAVSLKKAHNDCVYGSVLKQVEQLPVTQRPSIDMSMATEAAFAACVTEERALLTTLLAMRMPPPNIEIIMLRNKLDLKRDLQAIAADPAAYQARRR